MTLIILPFARDDLVEGYDFYKLAQDDLGNYFLHTLFSDIRSLDLTAGVHSKMFGFHRLLSRKFPYAVYYKLDGQTVRVWAVLDCRRNPLSIRYILTQRRAKY